MAMWRHLLERSIYGLLTLVLISALIFVATNVLPGDAARAILGRSATPEAVAALQAQLGLDRPLVAQYAGWVADILHGNLGNSVVTKGPVWDLVGPRIPEFVLAIVLILLLSTQVLQLLPPTAVLRPGQTVLQNPQVLVLPVMTLTLAIMPYLSRLIRASLIDALASEYVVTARLKGLPPRVILLRHALRNSLVPSIQGAALSLAYILGGAVVVEYIFQYPGLGSALQSAVSQRDLYVIQAIVLIFAFGYIVFNMIADMLTILMTPRLRS